MASRPYNEWSGRLAANAPGPATLTKGQIASATRLISVHAVFGEPPRHNGTKMTHDEAKQLDDMIHARPVVLTLEHTEQGLDWFRRRAERELGISRGLHDYIVANFDHFTWNGDVETEGAWPWVSEVPVWTIHLTDGSRYRYWYASGWRDSRGNVGHLWPVREEES